MWSNKGSIAMIHRSLGNFLFLTAKNRFDVVLTGKMTELDQFMYRFEILSKNVIEQGVDCHDSLIFREFSIFDREKPVWRHFDR